MASTTAAIRRPSRCVPPGNRPKRARSCLTLAVAGAAVLAFPAAADELPSPAADSSQQESAAARKVIDEAVARSLEQAAADAARKAGDSPNPTKSAGGNKAKTRASAAGGTAPQDLVVAKISAEVAARQLEAKRLSQRSPSDALDLLEEVAAEVSKQDIPEDSKAQLARRIERTRRDIEESTGKRRAELDLDRQNARIESQVDRERAARVEVDQRLAMLVEEYNALVDAQRFPEAEAIAKKAGQLAPDNPVVRQLLAQSRMIRRIDTQKSIDGEKQSGFLDVAEDSERSSTPFVGPIEFPATKDWADLTKNRTRLEAEGRARATPAEVTIQKKLGTPVKASHRNEPLSAVLDALAKQAAVPIHLDLVGLESESVRSDTPVTISLDQPISLKSALKLLLEPLHLAYVVKDEVLKVTSPRLVKGEVYSVSYQVADLVIPIPNFSSDGLGITGALRDGYSRISSRNALSVQTGPLPAGINGVSRTESDATVDPGSLAQIRPPSRSDRPRSAAARPTFSRSLTSSKTPSRRSRGIRWAARGPSSPSRRTSASS